MIIKGGTKGESFVKEKRILFSEDSLLLTIAESSKRLEQRHFFHCFCHVFGFYKKALNGEDF
jgi:hypothetical protein